jgi:steroid delta-isomerase-like uncharacterized protein
MRREEMNNPKFALLFAVVIATGATGISCSSSTVVKSNLDIIHRNYDDLWNKGNLAVAQEIYSNDYIGHDSQGAPPMRGVEGVQRHVSMYRGGFPNVQFTIEDLIASGDKVAVLWKAAGKHKGEMMGMKASEKDVAVMGISIFRIDKGKIQEAWFGWDKMDMMHQMGGELHAK